MYNLIKLEGRIQRLEIYDDSLSAFGKSGDTQITASAILSGVAEGVSLSAQTVFLASRSRLHVKSVVMEIGGKVCVGKFHRALFVKIETSTDILVNFSSHSSFDFEYQSTTRDHS